MLKKFFKEFKDFAVKGNAIDMAVGIVVGASFGKIVDSLVKDVIMPPVGVMLGNVDFTNMYFVLKEGTAAAAPYASLDAARAAGAITLNAGLFINTIISFVIVAFSIFLVVKALNNLKQKEAAPAAATKACPKCFTNIDIRATKCPNCTADL